MDDAQKRLVQLLKALANKDRIRLLLQLNDQTMSVGELVEELGRSQPSISGHLRILRDAELVERHQEGRTARYYLRDSRIVSTVMSTLNTFLTLLKRQEDQT